MYIPEGVKVSWPVKGIVEVLEGGDVQSKGDATLFTSSGTVGFWEFREAFVGHAKPAEVASRLFSMGLITIASKCECRAKANGEIRIPRAKTSGQS